MKRFVKYVSGNWLQITLTVFVVCIAATVVAQTVRKILSGQ